MPAARLATEDVRDIALARRLRTQGVLLHLPPQMEYDNFAHPSLAAAILLGLRAGDRWVPRTPRRRDHQRRPVGTRPSRAAHPRHRPRRHRLPRRILRPHQGFRRARRGTPIVRECPCRDEDRLACHRCLLPFAAPYDMDKVSRLTALKLLDDILDVGSHATPDLEDWTAEVTEKAPPPTPLSDESFLERDFYSAFIARLKLMGAAVVEKPGTYGPSATITLQGTTPRKWSLRPQVSLDFVKPDFVLQTADPEIPRIAIFADGRAFHAGTGDRNRVADDADKRAALRKAGYLVWSFGHDDLQRFKAGDGVDPDWFDQKAASFVTSRFHVSPGLVRLLSKDPVSQLLEFIVTPDIESWRHFSDWMPYLFVRNDNRVHSHSDHVAVAARAVLNGSAPFSEVGSDVCWTYAAGGVTVTAGVHSTTEPPRAVLAIDDRDDRLELLDGKAWKEWLRLSNWLGVSDRHRVTTHSLLAAAPSAPEVTETVALAPEWQAIFDEAVSDTERELITALADAGVAVPELGYETDSGDVIDMAWVDATDRRVLRVRRNSSAVGLFVRPMSSKSSRCCNRME